MNEIVKEIKQEQEIRVADLHRWRLSVELADEVEDMYNDNKALNYKRCQEILRQPLVNLSVTGSKVTKKSAQHGFIGR